MLYRVCLFFKKIGFIHSPLLVAVLAGNSFEKREEIEKQTGIHMFVNFADQKITLFGQPAQHKQARQKFDEILAVTNFFVSLFLFFEKILLERNRKYAMPK